MKIKDELSALATEFAKSTNDSLFTANNNGFYSNNYSKKDDLTGKFEFSYKDGKPFLKVLDTAIKRVVAGTAASRPSEIFIVPELPPEEVVVEEQPAKRLGVVFNFNATTYPYFEIDAVQGETNDAQNKYLGKVEKLDLTKFVNTELFSEDDKQLVQQVRKLQSTEINKYLDRNSPVSGIWENIIHTDGDELPEEKKFLKNRLATILFFICPMQNNLQPPTWLTLN